MIKTTFPISSRDIMGKKVNKLRAQKIVPGNVYVAGGESVALQFPEKEFNKLHEEVGDTGVVYLKIDDSKEDRPTLIDEVQIDPVTGKVVHVSFKEVDLKEKIEVEVQIELVGEFDIKEAVMVQVKNSVMVEALPTDLPEKFEVNIENLTEIGQSITLADLDFDKSKISLVEIENDEDWENPVVLVQEQREEEIEEVVEVAEEGEGEEGEGEEVAEEGEGEEGESEATKTSKDEKSPKKVEKKED